MTEGRARRAWIAALKLVLGLALVAGVILWVAPDLDALLARVRLDPLGLAVGLAMTAVTVVIVSARWKLMSEAMGGTRLPFVVYFRGLVLTKVVGQVTSLLAMDLVGRGLALRSAGASSRLGLQFTQALLERLFDVIIPATMLCWAIAVRRADAGPTAATLSFVLVSVVVAALGSLLLWPLTRAALRIYARVRAWRGASGPKPETEGPPPISRQVAAQVGVLGALRYASVIGTYGGITMALGVDIDLLTTALIMPVGQLASIIGITPGALGFQEVGWVGALRWVGGVDDLAIGVFVLGSRVLLTSFFAAIYVLAWPLTRRAP